MDLTFILDLYIPIVMVICLCVGFVLKRFAPTDNKWIPLILMILGAVIACIYSRGVTIDQVAAGMVTGLASVGLHQVFKQLIEPEDDPEEDPEDDPEK